MGPSDPTTKDRSAPSPMWRQVRRVSAVIGGSLLLGVGVVLLITPGPGIPAILGGLVILSAEVVWARRLLRKVRDRVGDKVPLPGVEKMEDDEKS